MRLLSSAVLAALLLAGPARAQTWRDYAYPEAGFAVHFPAAPAVAKGEYRTSAGRAVPAAIYSVRQQDAIYTMTVADFSAASVDQAAAIADAVKVASAAGQVKADVDARINSQYGRELSVKRPDGSLSMLAIFFFDKHLYALDGRAMSPDQSGSLAMRFQQSLQFPNR